MEKQCSVLDLDLFIKLNLLLDKSHCTNIMCYTVLSMSTVSNENSWGFKARPVGAKN